MLPEFVTASFLVVCLASFFLVNLYNLTNFHLGGKNVKIYTEIKRPESATLLLAALGTLLFFLESILFAFLAFTGFISVLQVFPLQLRFQHDFCVQIVGIVLTGAGYFLFIWSVVARGRYAVSWGMSENHRLVTWGPYRYVRHPSYHYVQITVAEEELLIRRFGEEYIRYQKKTGRFFPKRKKS